MLLICREIRRGPFKTRYLTKFIFFKRVFFPQYFNGTKELWKGASKWVFFFLFTWTTAIRNDVTSTWNYIEVNYKKNWNLWASKDLYFEPFNFQKKKKKLGLRWSRKGHLFREEKTRKIIEIPIRKLKRMIKNILKCIEP